MKDEINENVRNIEIIFHKDYMNKLEIIDNGTGTPNSILNSFFNIDSREKKE